MATTVTSVIDTAGGAGVDYTSLAAWQTAKAANIVAADQIQEAKCQGTGADTAAVTLTGWTTDATRYVRIYGATKNGTTYNTSKYRIELTNTSIIDIRTAAFFRLEDIQLKVTNNSSGSGRHGIFNNFAAYTTADIRLERNIIAMVASGTADSGTGIILGVNGSNVTKIANNFIYGFSAAGQAGISTQDGTFYIFNNTLRTCYNGIPQGSGTDTMVAKNNLVQATSSCFQFFSGTSASNISNDTSSPDASFRSKTITFTGADDCSHNDSQAKDLGADLTADANLPITMDIKGITRPQGSATDIGAYEYPVTVADRRILIAGVKQRELVAGVRRRTMVAGA